MHCYSAKDCTESILDYSICIMWTQSTFLFLPYLILARCTCHWCDMLHVGKDYFTSKIQEKMMCKNLVQVRRCLLCLWRWSFIMDRIIIIMMSLPMLGLTKTTKLHLLCCIPTRHGWHDLWIVDGTPERCCKTTSWYYYLFHLSQLEVCLSNQWYYHSYASRESSNPCWRLYNAQTDSISWQCLYAPPATMWQFLGMMGQIFAFGIDEYYNKGYPHFTARPYPIFHGSFNMYARSQPILLMPCQLAESFLAKLTCKVLYPFNHTFLPSWTLLWINNYSWWILYINSTSKPGRVKFLLNCLMSTQISMEHSLLLMKSSCIW
jgi:hypothetical protein